MSYGYCEKCGRSIARSYYTVSKEDEDKKTICRDCSGPCAASPWHYRDSNGDGTGEVVESAELPEEDGYYVYLPDDPFKEECPVDFIRIQGGVVYFKPSTREDICGNVVVDLNWLRKHLIAWAVINESKGDMERYILPGLKRTQEILRKAGGGA